jgi:hypothetical protein
MICDMEHLSEWGVPDWQNAAGYLDGGRSRPEWAWEFLRRNHGYRAFWREKIEPYLTPDGTRIWRNSNGESWPYLEELRSAFDVELPNPPSCLTPCSFVSEWLRSVDRTCGESLPSADDDDERVVRLSLRRNQVAFVVDLDRPTHKQLEAIARSLKQRRSGGVKLSRKSAHLLTYPYTTTKYK